MGVRRNHHDGLSRTCVASSPELRVAPEEHSVLLEELLDDQRACHGRGDPVLSSLQSE